MLRLFFFFSLIKNLLETFARFDSKRINVIRRIITKFRFKNSTFSSSSLDRVNSGDTVNKTRYHTHLN